ncbi:MAG: ATP-binding cassette domain-containing protein [Treponema sp.]|jgi:ABC-2 type transport system ATP-binding protein|nr:ATP-binding cassette domain-containing protein [Treponema sp.]
MIEVKNLSKKYGNFEAVKDVSFSVGSDQVLGFLGPNGAGKTTIMKILTGYHYPSAGEALVDGVSVQEEPVELKKRIGYLPEGVPLYGDLTVDEYLTFVAEGRGIPKKRRKEAIDSSFEACGLKDMRSRLIEQLSKGYKQRTGLAQAIVHDPAILILDEPTTGLDPNQIIEIRSLIRELGKRKTVILSTHILQEVEAICSQVLILNSGRIAAQGRPEEIAGAMKGGDTWELILKGAEIHAVRSALARLANLIEGGLQNQKTEILDNGLIKAVFFVSASAAENGERIFDWAIDSSFKILGMSRKKLSLEDIFVELTHEPGSRNEASPPEGAGR